jgi:hypothetical protein
VRPARKDDNFTTVFSCLADVAASIFHNRMGLHGLLGDRFTFLYVDDVRTSQETPTGLHARYVISFTLYIYDVRTSQETPLHLHGLLHMNVYYEK